MESWASDSRLRLRRIFDKSNALITALGDAHLPHVTASPRIAKRGREVTYTLSVKGRMHDPSTEFELAEVLFHTRALLDNLTWDLAHADPNIEYNEEQQRRITFPVARASDRWTAEENWAHTVRTKPHLKQMPPELLERIRRMQSFASDIPSDAVLDWVDALHQVDKHRTRVHVRLGLDPQWTTLFPIAPELAVRSATYDWLPPADETLRTGLPLVRVTTAHGVTGAKGIDVPVSHFVWLDGERWDYQDFIWDLQILALRGYEILRGVEPTESEKLRLVAEYRRTRVLTLQRDVRHGTDEYGRFFAGEDPTADFSVSY
jgi:hypothetical protein